MTHSNLMQEIDEAVHRKKLEAFWKRYGATLVGCAAALVLGTALYTYWTNHRVKVETAATAGLIQLLEDPKSNPDEQAAAFKAFSEEHKGETPAAMARFHLAATALKTNKLAEAVALYDALADDHSVDPALRSYAALLSVQVQMDTGDAAKLQEKLTPLLAPESVWRFSAKELAGHLALRSNDREKARTLFSELSTDEQAPQSIAKRAADMLRLLPKTGA